MAWQGLEGHDAVVERFVRADAQGRLAGTYLFIGPPGVGKGCFALALARALVCEAPRPGLVPCGGCASCIQAAAGTHPDIDVVRKPEDRASIPLEAFIGDQQHRMREGLCWRLLLRPALGTRKVALILDADHLLDEAANCLLKTLEEPPPGAVIILVGTALERQLPTIRSRCQTIRFGPLEPAAVARAIAREAEANGVQVDTDRLAASAAGCGGSLDRARLLLDPDLGRFRETLIGLLGRRPLAGVELARETIAIMEAAGKEAPARRARLRMAFDAAIEFYRAALRHDAAPGHADPLLGRAVAGWHGDREAAVEALITTLDAVDALERNANLTVLVDAWTAGLEDPRFARPS